MVYGSPAVIHGWMCECGNKIEFSGNQGSCIFCKKTFEKNNEVVKERAQ
jgi:hypothetical protein